MLKIIESKCLHKHKCIILDKIKLYMFYKINSTAWIKYDWESFINNLKFILINIYMYMRYFLI